LLLTNLLPIRNSRPLITAGAFIVALFVACGGSDIKPTAVVAPGATREVSCVLSGPSSEFPVRAVPGIDVLPTEFDGVNTAECTFLDEIVEVKVTLFHVGGPLAGFEATSDSIAIEAHSRIAFPIPQGSNRNPVDSRLPLGAYVRSMEAVTVSGELIEIQTELNEVATEVFLVDASNATIMWRTGPRRTDNEHLADQDA
jgi:hypothetical protein